MALPGADRLRQRVAVLGAAARTELPRRVGRLVLADDDVGAGVRHQIEVGAALVTNNVVDVQIRRQIEVLPVNDAAQIQLRAQLIERRIKRRRA